MQRQFNCKTNNPNITCSYRLEYSFVNGMAQFRSSVIAFSNTERGQYEEISGTGEVTLKILEKEHTIEKTTITNRVSEWYHFELDVPVAEPLITTFSLSGSFKEANSGGYDFEFESEERIALIPNDITVSYTPVFDEPFFAKINAPKGLWVNYRFRAYPNLIGGLQQYVQSGRFEEYSGGEQEAEFDITFEEAIGFATTNTKGVLTSVEAEVYCKDDTGSLLASRVTVSEDLLFPEEKVAPEVSLTVEITDPFEGICVQGHSGLNVTVSGEETYSSPITGYSLYINDRIYPLTDGVWQSDVIRLYGTLNIKAEARNTRLVKGEARVLQEVYEYSAPTLAPVTGETSVVARRANDEGAEDDGGGNLYIGAVASYKSLNGKNVCKLTYRLAPTGASISDAEWTEADGTEINGIVQAIDNDKGYVVEVGVSDSLTTEKYILSFAIATAEIFMIASAKNNAMYFGYYGNEKNVVSVGGNLTMLSNGVYNQIIKSQNGTITIENFAERDYALVFGVGVLGLITLAAGEISWQGTNGITLSYENGTVTVSELMSEDYYTVIRRMNEL